MVSNKLYKSGHGTSSFIQNIYRAKYKKTNQSVLPKPKRSGTVRIAQHTVENPNKSSSAIARSKTSISPNLNQLRSFKKPGERFALTDQTRVATTTWKNLRKLAMMNNYD